MKKRLKLFMEAKEIKRTDEILANRKLSDWLNLLQSLRPMGQSRDISLSEIIFRSSDLDENVRDILDDNLTTIMGLRVPERDAEVDEMPHMRDFAPWMNDPCVYLGPLRESLEGWFARSLRTKFGDTKMKVEVLRKCKDVTDYAENIKTTLGDDTVDRIVKDFMRERGKAEMKVINEETKTQNVEIEEIITEKEIENMHEQVEVHEESKTQEVHGNYEIDAIVHEESKIQDKESKTQDENSKAKENHEVETVAHEESNTQEVYENHEIVPEEDETQNEEDEEEAKAEENHEEEEIVHEESGTQDEESKAQEPQETPGVEIVNESSIVRGEEEISMESPIVPNPFSPIDSSGNTSEHEGDSASVNSVTVTINPLADQPESPSPEPTDSSQKEKKKYSFENFKKNLNKTKKSLIDAKTILYKAAASDAGQVFAYVGIISLLLAFSMLAFEWASLPIAVTFSFIMFALFVSVSHHLYGLGTIAIKDDGQREDDQGFSSTVKKWLLRTVVMLSKPSRRQIRICGIFALFILGYIVYDNVNGDKFDSLVEWILPFVVAGICFSSIVACLIASGIRAVPINIRGQAPQSQPKLHFLLGGELTYGSVAVIGASLIACVLNILGIVPKPDEAIVYGLFAMYGIIVAQMQYEFFPPLLYDQKTFTPRIRIRIVERAVHPTVCAICAFGIWQNWTNFKNASTDFHLLGGATAVTYISIGIFLSVFFRTYHGNPDVVKTYKRNTVKVLSILSITSFVAAFLVIFFFPLKEIAVLYLAFVFVLGVSLIFMLAFDDRSLPPYTRYLFCSFVAIGSNIVVLNRWIGGASVGIVTVLYLFLMVKKLSKEQAEYKISIKQRVSQEIIIPIFIVFVVFGVGVFWDEVSQDSVLIAAWGSICYITICSIISLNCKQSSNVAEHLALGTFICIELVLAILLMNGWSVLILMAIYAEIALFRLNVKSVYADLDFNGLRNASASRRIMYSVPLWFGSAIAYCIEFWPNILSDLDVGKHVLPFGLWTEGLLLLCWAIVFTRRPDWRRMLQIKDNIFFWARQIFYLGSPFVLIYLFGKDDDITTGDIHLNSAIFVFLFGCGLCFFHFDYAEFIGSTFFSATIGLCSAWIMEKEDRAYNWGTGLVMAVGVTCAVLYCYVAFRYAISHSNTSEEAEIGYTLIPSIITIALITTLFNVSYEALTKSDPNTDDQWTRILCMALFTIVFSVPLFNSGGKESSLISFSFATFILSILISLMWFEGFNASEDFNSWVYYIYGSFVCCIEFAAIPWLRSKTIRLNETHSTTMVVLKVISFGMACICVYSIGASAVCFYNAYRKEIATAFSIFILIVCYGIVSMFGEKSEED
eukprot:TRINITY_DN777919_c0_g1_i1.p1 TRINITY_DN777919_c0_g1~~TRINITY_DN777919_c0_g1_i1.p1  ORF type:complete len:1480 (+),score=277.81 TRINITY_DN777919_c0_g1_i1:421-4440(+)